MHGITASIPKLNRVRPQKHDATRSARPSSWTTPWVAAWVCLVPAPCIA